MISLRPGTYEVGREDGTIEPFLIVVGTNRDVKGATMETYDLFCKAIQGEEGWWFRYVYIPDTCPAIDTEGNFQ